jgi:hypothetical protein
MGYSLVAVIIKKTALYMGTAFEQGTNRRSRCRQMLIDAACFSRWSIHFEKLNEEESLRCIRAPAHSYRTPRFFAVYSLYADMRKMETVMHTIQQTVQIPANRRLQLDLTIPESIPTGEAEVQVIFSPLRQNASLQEDCGHLGFMRGQGVIPEDTKAVGREEIIAMFEGRE